MKHSEKEITKTRKRLKVIFNCLVIGICSGSLVYLLTAVLEPFLFYLIGIVFLLMFPVVGIFSYRFLKPMVKEWYFRVFFVLLILSITFLVNLFFRKNIVLSSNNYNKENVDTEPKEDSLKFEKLEKKLHDKINNLDTLRK